jgi:hypothetical protein
MNTKRLKNSDYIEGLIGYILDIKPYHSKLTEVIEEYHFDDDLNVEILDQHRIQIKLSSIWCTEYYSDGNRVLYRLPAPVVRPRYDSDDSHNLYDGVIDHDSEVINLSNTHSTYHVPDNDGEKWVKVNNSPKIEGLDYYVSRGIFSLEMRTELGERQWMEKIHYDSGFSWWKAFTPWNNTPNWAPGPHGGIAVNPSAPNEIWSFIKINPISYTRPIFVTGQLGIDDHYYWGYDLANYDSGGDDIDCVTDGPDNDNYYVSGGYNAGELYDDRRHCFDLVNLNFTLVDNDAPSEIWTVMAISPTTFSVVGSVSGPTANATLNVPYNNGIISFTISTTNPLFQAIPGLDIFYFTVVNPAPFITLHPIVFWNCPAQSWTITAISATEFSVVGSVSGIQPNAYVNQTYNNGLISFTIYSGDYVFEPGEFYTFYTIDPRPSYLIHGSISGMQKPASIGVPYNNGLIAFTLKEPEYFLNGSIVTTYNVPLLLNGLANISFLKKPRFDAISEIIKLRVLTPTTISVESSVRGMLKGATLNVPYYDDYISFEISGTLIPGQTHSFEILTHKYDLYYGKHKVIFGNTVFSGSDVISIDSVVHNLNDKVEINTTKYDKIFISFSDPSDYPVEFGNQWDPLHSSIPFYTDGNGIFFPDKEFQTNLNLDNIHPTYPSITKVGKIINDGYVIEFDQNFINQFLPINTGFNICVHQEETHNNRVATTITDEIKFADSYRMSDNLNVQINDEISFYGIVDFSYLDDTLNVQIGEKAYLPAGYDIEPYDLESYYNIINPPSSYDYSELIELITSAPAGFRIYDNFTQNPYAPYNNDGDSSLTNISESFVLYSQQAPSNFDINSFDSDNFDSLATNIEAIVMMPQMSLTTPSNPLYGHPLIDPVPGTTVLAYAKVTGSDIGTTLSIKNVTVDYKGSPGLGMAPTVIILDDLINQNVLEVVTPVPIAAGPNIYSSFKLTLTVNLTNYVIVITV